MAIIYYNFFEVEIIQTSHTLAVMGAGVQLSPISKLLLWEGLVCTEQLPSIKDRKRYEALRKLSYLKSWGREGAQRTCRETKRWPASSAAPTCCNVGQRSRAQPIHISTFRTAGVVGGPWRTLQCVPRVRPVPTLSSKCQFVMTRMQFLLCARDMFIVHWFLNGCRRCCLSCKLSSLIDKTLEVQYGQSS